MISRFLVRGIIILFIYHRSKINTVFTLQANDRNKKLSDATQILVLIVGRSRDLIISVGYNVYPQEVETLIDGLEGVKESAVIGLPHPDFGEGVAAVIVGAPGVALTEHDICAALKDKLAGFKQPKRIFFTREFPRNAMGKVQKSRLREWYGDAF